MLFKKLLAQSGNQTDIFWKFYLLADTLVAQNHQASVRLHHCFLFLCVPLLVFIGHTFATDTS